MAYREAGTEFRPAPPSKRAPPHRAELTPASEVPLAPPPPSTAHQAHPLLARQAAELAPQVLQRVGTHRLTLAAQYRKTHRTIEGRQVAGLEPARLSLLEPQPDHARPLLHVVIHGHAVAVQVNRRRQRVELVAHDVEQGAGVIRLRLKEG